MAYTLGLYGTINNPDLTSVHSRLSFAQSFSHWLGNHSVQEVISLLHLIVQHLHALLQLTGLLLLLRSQCEIRQKHNVSLYLFLSPQVCRRWVIWGCQTERRASEQLCIMQSGKGADHT